MEKSYAVENKYMKGENMFIQNEDVFKVFKTLLSLNSDYLINKIESTNKIKNGIITIILN